MKLKFSIAINMILFALFAFAANAQAQTGKQQQIPNNPQPQPQLELAKPALFGAIIFSAPSDAKLSAFHCSDFTVVVGFDSKTDGNKQGGVSVPFLQTVASGKAIKNGSQCRYRVGAIPVGKPFKVELRVTNQKKFACDVVPLTYSYSPLKTLDTITFKADQVEERNFQVTGIKCSIVK